MNMDDLYNQEDMEATATLSKKGGSSLAPPKKSVKGGGTGNVFRSSQVTPSDQEDEGAGKDGKSKSFKPPSRSVNVEAEDGKGEEGKTKSSGKRKSKKSVVKKGKKKGDVGDGGAENEDEPLDWGEAVNEDDQIPEGNPDDVQVFDENNPDAFDWGDMGGPPAAEDDDEAAIGGARAAPRKSRIEAKMAESKSKMKSKKKPKKKGGKAKKGADEGGDGAEEGGNPDEWPDAFE